MTVSSETHANIERKETTRFLKNARKKLSNPGIKCCVNGKRGWYPFHTFNLNSTLLTTNTIILYTSAKWD